VKCDRSIRRKIYMTEDVFLRMNKTTTVKSP
jgi:hypothetical protein